MIVIGLTRTVDTRKHDRRGGCLFANASTEKIPFVIESGIQDRLSFLGVF